MPCSVAIDGPAGAGKSTIAKMLAQRLEYLYIDTGAMYRALTLKALREAPGDSRLSDRAYLARLAGHTRIELETVPGEANPRVFLDGEDVTIQIRDPMVTKCVSRVANVPEVRREMVSQQRTLAAHANVVMDGRDVGTRVLPASEHKVFLTADLEARTRRRWLEMQRQGYEVDLVQLRAEIVRRDLEDTTREVGPLVRAPDALVVDTTFLEPEEVVEVILRFCGKG